MFLCVCVLRLVDVLLTGEKGRKRYDTKFQERKKLNHPFTGTTLHTLASKSTPERLFSSSHFFPPLTDFSSSQFFPPLTEEF